MSDPAAPQLRILTTPRPGEPLSRARQPEPAALVIFGATGDLAQRKLIPALYNLSRDGFLPERCAVVAFSRSAQDDAQLRAKLREGVVKYSRTQPIDERVWESFARRIECVPGAIEDAAAFQRLRVKLDDLDRRYDLGGNRLFYMATPASSFGPILQQLSAAGLAQRAAKGAHPWERVVVEKPFGHDLASAQALNNLLGASLDESQIYRIDHYLGKETVQNILVFRFANSIWEPLWNHKHVDHVEITAAEQIGIEGRGRFYDETGVLRDMVQNHLLQVLAMVAMEPPVSMGADDIRDERTKVFRSLRRITAHEVADSVVAGQYAGYRDEEGVAKDSRTPTYVAMQLMLDNWRWQGVPFFVRAGKRLAQRRTEVSIHFKSVPHCVFNQDDICQRLEPNVLTLRIQPKEGIALGFECKEPGEDLSVSGVTMDFAYANAFQKAAQEAYERLLLDCLRGSATLFSRRDGVEEAWRFITPILEGLDQPGAQPVSYAPGSDGPSEASALIRKSGRRWTRLA